MHILTYDKHIIEYNDNILKYSTFLLNLPKYNETVYLNNKSSTFNIINKIVYFLNNHFIFTEKNKDKDFITMWNNNFFDLPDKILFEIIKASNYLDIECIFELGCIEVANIVKKCYTPQNVRKRFNIKDDMTPEEEEEIYKTLPFSFYKVI